MGVPRPNSAHRDEARAAKCRVTAPVERPSYVTRWRLAGWGGGIRTSASESRSVILHGAMALYPAELSERAAGADPR
jgi:hypothetical protein